MNKTVTEIIQERDEYINQFIINCSEKRIIPRIIFQTWETNSFSPEFQNLIDTWKEINPEYEYFLYNNEEREEFIRVYYHKRIYNAYCRIIPGAYKADLWRYCILHKYGGIYTDIDTLCLGRIDYFINENTDFVITIDFNTNIYEGKHNLANAFIASIPNHKILTKCIHNIVYNVEFNILPNGVISKLDFSGPGLIGMSTNNYLNLYEKESFIGKEGYNNSIHFLKFHEETEYVSNTEGIILFQNKNGNTNICNLYNNECKKITHIDWVTTKTIIKPKKIAIFNSFNFHYEMFGYILNYCKKYNYTLDIYTEFNYELGFFDFYKNLFGMVDFKIIFYKEFDNYIYDYDNIILTTDDDNNFKNEWIEDIKLKNKIICINHTTFNRRQNIDVKFQIGTRLFHYNPIKWAIPCYPIVQEIQDKIKIMENKKNRIEVAIIGGNNINCNIINRLTSDKNIILYIMNRHNDKLDEKFINNPKIIEIIKKENIDTIEMMKIAEKMNYILTDCTIDLPHIIGESMSGCIPLAHSTLTQLIISKQNNIFYSFKSAITFELLYHNAIVLKDNMDIDTLQTILNERNDMVDMFHHHMQNIILS